MYKNRIRHLEEMHARLDRQIDDLERNGRFDDVQLNNLKKQRLNLKDQMADLKRRQWEHDHEYMENDDE